MSVKNYYKHCHPLSIIARTHLNNITFKDIDTKSTIGLHEM